MSVCGGGCGLSAPPMPPLSTRPFLRFLRGDENRDGLSAEITYNCAVRRLGKLADENLFHIAADAGPGADRHSAPFVPLRVREGPDVEGRRGEVSPLSWAGFSHQAQTSQGLPFGLLRSNGRGSGGVAGRPDRAFAVDPLARGRSGDGRWFERRRVDGPRRLVWPDGAISTLGPRTGDPFWASLALIPLGVAFPAGRHGSGGTGSMAAIPRSGLPLSRDTVYHVRRFVCFPCA